MRALKAIVGPVDEIDGGRLGYALIEMAEYEIKDMREEKVRQIERGTTLHVARGLIEDVAAIDKAMSMIRIAKDDARRNGEVAR